MTESRRTVLISGASIAGPALAYWLHKYGFDVTVVERGATVRPGGLPIDIRGAAIEVSKRMGIHDELVAGNIDTQRFNFVNEAGEVVTTVTPADLMGDDEGCDVEIARDTLTNMLWEHSRDDVPYIFNESIDTVTDRGDRVDVTFRNGTPAQSFDLVIGADGLHSNTRRLVFGDESHFEKYIGRYFATFTTENTLGLSRETMCLNLTTKNRMVLHYAVGDKPDRVFCSFSFDCPEPPPLEKRDLDAQRRLFHEVFGDVGWEAPRIHMPHLSKGRVVLVGDAGYAASFLSGQGSSLALVGAYVLSGELATNPDHRSAMESYERIMRPFIKANQAIATGGRKKLNPRTKGGLHLRNFIFNVLIPLARRLGLGRFVGGKFRSATAAIDLPDYSALVSAV